MAMTDAQFGLLTSIFLWVYAGFSPLGGLLADRVGRQRVILGSLLFWSAATWLSGHARSFDQLFLARGLMGVSEACYIPAALALIADYHRGPTRSLATGLHMSGTYTGAALGGVGGYLAELLRLALRVHVVGRGGSGLRTGADVLSAGRAVSTAARGRTAHRPTAGRQPVWASLFGQLRILRAAGAERVRGRGELGGLRLAADVSERTFFARSGCGGDVGDRLYPSGFPGGARWPAAAWADRWSRRRRQGRALVPAIGYFAAAPCLFLAASTHALPVAIAGMAVFGLRARLLRRQPDAHAPRPRRPAALRHRIRIPELYRIGCRRVDGLGRRRDEGSPRGPGTCLSRQCGRAADHGRHAPPARAFAAGARPK